MGHPISLSIVSTFNSKGVKDAANAISSLGSSIGKAAKGFIAYQAVQGVTNIAGDLVTQAMDLQRNTAGLTTIFGENAQAMEKWATTAFKMGLSTSDASKAATFLGSVLKSAGFDMDTTAEQTKQLTSLAADLAVTYGYDVQEALTGMTALFRGEYDPIEKFGVAMKQSQINAELAARGLDKLTGAELLNAQQIIRMELLYKNTADVQGAYARQQGSLFTSTSTLTAVFKDFEAQMGKPMLAPLASMMDKLAALLGDAKSGANLFGNALGQMITAITPLVLSIANLALAFGEFFGGISAGVGAALAPLIAMLSGLVNILSFILQALAPIAPAFGFLATVMLTGYAAGMLWKALVGVYETVALSVMYLKDAYLAMAAGQNVAAASANNLKVALVSTGIGALIVGIGSLIAWWMSLADATNTATQAQLDYNNTPLRIPASPTGGETGNPAGLESVYRPKAPKPGEKHTYWIYNTKAGRYDWYEITWDGKKWSKPKLMTYDPPSSPSSPSAPTQTAAQKRREQQKAVLKQFVEDVKAMAKDLSDGLMDAFDLTGFGKSATAMLRDANKLVAKMMTFASNLKILQGMNLSPALMNQIISAGPIQGGAIAAALVQGGAGVVSSLSNTYAQYGALATQVGTMGAAGYYGSAAVQNTYNIQVSGGVGDKNTIGKAIIEAIKTYEAQSGAGWRA